MTLSWAPRKIKMNIYKLSSSSSRQKHTVMENSTVPAVQYVKRFAVLSKSMTGKKNPSIIAIFSFVYWHNEKAFLYFNLAPSFIWNFPQRAWSLQSLFLPHQNLSVKRYASAARSLQDFPCQSARTPRTLELSQSKWPDFYKHCTMWTSTARPEKRSDKTLLI